MTNRKNTLINYFISILILFYIHPKNKSKQTLQTSIIKYTHSSSPFHLASSSFLRALLHLSLSSHKDHNQRFSKDQALCW
ncbi:hypothetical protein DsansV1_C46g0241721 [Dioscorea sansibarensis]